MAGTKAWCVGFCSLVAASLAAEPVSQSCSDGTCHSSQRQSMLMQHAHNSSKRMALDDGYEMKGSCIDGKDWDKTYPPGFSLHNQPKANPDAVEEECVDNYGWPMSEWASGLITGAGRDIEDYKFKVCYNKAGDPEKRWFPWAYMTDPDSWKLHEEAENSVHMYAKDVSNTWRYGFQEIMLDALEYFAREGEIAGRKIKPRFFLYGWSKGCTFIYNMNKWVPHVIQGIVCLSGCNDKDGAFLGKELPKKSRPEGAAPILYIYSQRETFLKCSPGDSKKMIAFLTPKTTSFVDSYAFPCGHHPNNCMPSCDPEEIFANPFWAFKEKAEEWAGGCQASDKDTCESWLCVWDDDLADGSKCHPEHPVVFGQQCEQFCSSSGVDSCDGLGEADCGASHVSEKGWYKKCVFSSGSCAASDKEKQCLFQEDCPSAAAA